MKKISVEYNGSLITTPLEGIFSFSNTDIWVTNGFPIHGDGNSWVMYHLQDMGLSLSVSKAWGKNSNDMYFVGRAGSIAHYQNGSWSKIESGTTTIINNIWGVENSLILATVSDRWHLGDYKLLSISNSADIDTFIWPFTRLYGVWFNSARKIYVVGDGIHLYKNGAWSKLNLTTNFTTRVKGTALNDIYIAGCCNTLIHFNGLSWQTIAGIYGNYEGLDVKENLIVTGGWTTDKAIIIMGKRY